jgi:putative hydrolase of the HAD superfamily
MRARACSFDFGQTLASLDTRLLSEKLGRRGVVALEAELDAGLRAAWATYDQAVRAGLGGHPWRVFMRALLEPVARDGEAPLEARRLDETVEWLWSEQPKENLWRKPIDGMLQLCRDLAGRGVPIGVLSNSEGKLRELIAEMGLSELLPLVADSGVLGIEKPDRRIFEWLGREIGVELGSVVHVGDSLEADVEGAIAAGMFAIWFSPSGGAGRADPSRVSSLERVRICGDAAEVRGVLAELGLPV